MRDFKLYVIIDTRLASERNLCGIALEAIAGGADIIQLRDKISSRDEFLDSAVKLRRITKEKGVDFIINDNPEIALEVDADGAHLGQGDMPISEARKILGRNLIGMSTHSLKEALDAQQNGADYIGIGPIFPSPTKPNLMPIGPDVLRAVSKNIKIPFAAIGGIDTLNLPQVIEAGAARVAVASAVMLKDDIKLEVRKLKDALDCYDTVRVG